MRALALLPLLALVVARPAAAKPLVVDRVVAVVDASPILLSEIVERARIFAKRLDDAHLEGDKRAAAEAQIRKELLQKIVDERLVAAEAKRRFVSVTDDEVALALATLAKQNKTTLEGLLAEAAKAGLDQASYRDEVRRQLLEGRLVSIALRQDAAAPRSETEGAFEKKRKELLASLRERAYVEVRP